MAEERARGVGQSLRQAREDAGLKVSDLAATTRVGARYIEALEAEDWSLVPGAVIGRGFVRMLARELNLDPAPLVEAYRVARGEGDATPDHVLPETDWKVDLRSETRRRPFLISALVLLPVLLSGLWFWWPRSQMEPPTVAPVSTVEEKASVAAVPPLPTAGSDSPALAAVEPVAVGPYRLGIQAVEKVWVRVQSDAADPQDRLIEPGELVEYRAAKGFRVKVGNAGSVRLTWDGAALLVPGAPGEVKTLEFPAVLTSLRP